MNYSIRHALPQDLPRIEEIYAYAHQFMQDSGNPEQWGTQYPPHDQLVSDIDKSLLYVITGEENIHGVFYFYIGEDPTYAQIFRGSWRADTLYGTIHRIAGDGSGGIDHAGAVAGDTDVFANNTNSIRSQLRQHRNTKWIIDLKVKHKMI